MKKLIFTSILCVCALTGYSQNQGPHFNAGLGLDGRGIPVYASYDWGFKEDFNLGVGAAFNTGGDEFDGGVFGAGFFTQWYADRVLDIPSDFDAYAGIGVYYYNHKNGDDLDLGLFIGGRYYFNDKIGLNLEFGGGTLVQGGRIGVSWAL